MPGSTEPCSACSLGDLEDPQEADAAEHGDAQGCHGARLHQQELQDAAAHHEAVKAVEDGHEVLAQAQPVHLHQHLNGEEGQQHPVGDICGSAAQIQHQSPSCPHLRASCNAPPTAPPGIFFLFVCLFNLQKPMKPGDFCPLKETHLDF